MAWSAQVRMTAAVLLATTSAAIHHPSACVAQPAPPAAEPTTQAVQDDLAQLIARVADESIRQDDRDEAARRLVSRGSDEARAAIRGTLETGPRSAQLATARALAAAPSPDPALVSTLLHLIGPDRLLSDAAIRALSLGFRENPQVLTHLVNLAAEPNEREATRLSAINALASTPEKRSAAALVEILSSEDDAPTVTAAAAAALADLTGLAHTDGRAWRQWWLDNRDKPDAEFRQTLVASQAARFDRLRQRQRELQDEVASLLTDQYQLSPDATKPDTLLRYLRSPEPTIRATGARLFFDDAVNNRTIPAPVLAQLRTMVGDSSAEVRLAVADALRAVNDSQATTPLLAQLARETAPPVRAAIARALGASGDVRALPAIRAMLDDPSLPTARAAAEAIRELAPAVREAGKGLARDTAIQLREVLDRRGGERGSQLLKESLVMAMAPLREPSLIPTYYRLLRSAESGPVRRAALKGLGELREPQAADAIVGLLDDADATVRLEAVDALGKVGTIQHAASLHRRMNPEVEEDPSVRDRAWLAMQALFPTAPTDQLTQWAERFANDPQRRLAVLLALVGRDTQAEPLAYTRKAIGDTLISLNRPADAVPYLRDSLGYWSAKDPKGMTAVSLSQQLLNALLRAKQYPAAVTFSGQLLSADNANQQTVGPAFRAEARRLIDTDDLPSAQQMIAESRRISPPMDARYAQALSDMESEIRRRLADSAERRTNGPRSAAALTTHASRLPS